MTTGLDSTTSAPLSLNGLFERLCASARELCGSDTAQIAFRDPVSGDVLYRRRAGGFDGKNDVEEELVRIEPGKGIGGQVLATGRPHRTADLAADGRFAGAYGDSIHYEGAVLVTPARIEDRTEALFYVHRRSGRPFTDRDELILTALTDHVATTIRNAQLYNDVSRHERVLEGLTRQLVTVQEAERKRLSSEIHDEVGQSLSAIKVLLILLLDDLRDLDGSVRTRIATAVNAIGDTLREVRRISADLRPLSLDMLGLVAALQGHVDRFVTLTGFPVDFSIEGRPRPLDPEISTLLYRVTQEALTNVARHGAATRVWARLRYRESLVELTITDDGRGFDAESMMQGGWKDGHFGLIGIQERIRQLGGTFLVSSAPSAGTRLMVEIHEPGPARVGRPISLRGDE